MRRGRGRRGAPALLAVVLVAGCTVSVGTSASTSSGPSASGTASRQGLTGQHVRVLGVWSGPEYDSFATVTAAWKTATGATVDWEGTQDPAASLDTAIGAGDPPDIAVLPTVGLMDTLAAHGDLVRLDSFMDMGQVATDYAPAWTDLGSHDGVLYGLFVKVSDKATVWYDPEAFAAAHYEVPTTWAELIDLANRMVKDGRAPFSVVAPMSPASGWALTDWVSQLVLSTCGPDLYDSWVAGTTPWTSACVTRAFDLFETILRTPGYVLGGAQGVLTTTDANGVLPVYASPPTAYMYYLASFAQAFISAAYPTLPAGRGYGFFPFPTVDPRYAGSVTVGADVVVMTKDTPAARSLMTYLAGEKAQETWVRLGGFTSVNRNVPPDSYPDPVAQEVARHLTTATVVRFGAGDAMPAALQRAWWAAMVDLVDHPTRLRSILTSLTRTAQGAG